MSYMTCEDTGDAEAAGEHPAQTSPPSKTVAVRFSRTEQVEIVNRAPQIGNYFIELGDWRNPTLTAALTAVADLVTHDVPTAVVAGVLAELAQRYRHLKDNEKAVFEVLGRLAQGGSIYKVWIAQDQLLDAMDSEMDPDDRKRLLANMKSRGILEEGADKWRAVW